MVRFVVSCMSQILSNGFVILDILAIFVDNDFNYAA